jgi:hypothetical protein
VSQDIIQTRPPNQNTPSSFSTTALGQIAIRRIASIFCKHPTTHGDALLTEVEQGDKNRHTRKELLVKMNRHFDRILPWPLVLVNSEDFGGLEQHPEASRTTGMKPDVFATF